MLKPPGPIDVNAQIPLERRPLAFATTELILDLLFVARTRFGGDYERMWIYLCVAHTSEAGITRRELVAHSGLARETVRRKVQQLVETDELKVGRRGRLFAVANDDNECVIAFNREAKLAARRYAQRVARFGVTLD